MRTTPSLEAAAKALLLGPAASAVIGAVCAADSCCELRSSSSIL
jgi:hypothetical protein